MAAILNFGSEEQIRKHVLEIIMLTVFIFTATAKTSKKLDEHLESKNTIASKWFLDYQLVKVDVCSPNLKNRMKVSFTVKHIEYIIDFSKEYPIWQRADIYVNSNRLDKPFNSSFTDRFNVYSGRIRQPCCDHKAIMKVTPEGLDIFIKTFNDTRFIEPASRYNLSNSSTKFTREKSSCQRYACVFYQSGDVRPKSVVATAAYLDPLSTGRKEECKEDKRKINKRSLHDTECSLHITADHTFYREIGHSDIMSTISEMLYLVSETNLIFRGTDFAGDGEGDNIGFQVGNITIFTSPVGYKMADKSDVHEYLNSFAEYNFDRFCLATSFSSRDFADVIGLAWIASPNEFGPPGGICQKRINTNGKLMSYNTALITTTSRGERLPMYHSVVILAHEFGHNFGSPHDETSDAYCAPGDDYGNYIMYPSASNDIKPNSDIFSPCSISYMFPVIRNKGSCFEDSKEPVCGNGIVEENEECDCGTQDTCQAIDPCCTPNYAGNTHSDLPCTVRRSAGKECSFKTSPCCSDSCTIITAMDKKICRHKRDCTLPALCNGFSEHCPTETPELDGSLCNSGRKTCSSGRCVGSICAVENTFPCMCQGSDQCYECCMSNTTMCSTTWSKTNDGRKKIHGALCDDGKGFCDGNGRCVSGDRKSTLDRMNQAFSDPGYNSVRDWFSANWYYVVGGAVTLGFLIAIFMSTCRENVGINSGAYIHGQFLRVSLEAEIHKNYLEKRQKEIRELYRRKLTNLDVDSTQMNFSHALTRMMTFFPTAPAEVLIKTLKTSGNEDTAVKWLLLRQYPFRRVSHPIEMEK